MKKSEIKAIIFDLGGVIAFYDHMIAAKKMSKIINIPPKRIFNVLSGKDKFIFTEKCELGAPVKEYWGVMGDYFNKKIPIEKFNYLWNTIFTPNKKIVSIIKKLKKQYKIVLISNISYNHKNHVLKNYPLKKLFSILIFSCNIKTRKPGLKIFKITLKKLKLKPSQCIFIDDVKENIKGAKKAGLYGIQFKSNNQLLKDLRKLSIKV